jgi:hypothetical protein
MSVLKKARNDRNKRINVMIGEYVEKGYTFISRDNMSDFVLFYHHANNHLQDDVVFVSVHINPDGTYRDERINVPREGLLKVTEDVKDIKSNKIKSRRSE